MQTFEEKRVQMALTALDPDLFLDKRFDPVRKLIYYAVCHIIEPGTEPYVAVDWRTPEGLPKPLSLDLVDQVRSQEGSIKEALTQAMVNNAALKELRRQELETQVQESLEWADQSKKRLHISGPWSRKADVD
jgi:hypothetical protein